LDARAVGGACAPSSAMATQEVLPPYGT
jgi:hypothetical protein